MMGRLGGGIGRGRLRGRCDWWWGGRVWGRDLGKGGGGGWYLGLRNEKGGGPLGRYTDDTKMIELRCTLPGRYLSTGAAAAR